MIILYLLAYIILFIGILFIYFRFLRNTIFGVNLKKNSYTGFFIIFDYLIFVFPATVVLLLVDPKLLWVAFNIDANIVPNLGLMISAQYLILFSMFYFLGRNFLMYRLSTDHLNVLNDGFIAKFILKYFTIYGFLIVASSMIFFEASHALHSSYFYGENLFVTRSYAEAHPILRYVKFSCSILMPTIAFLVGYVSGLNFFSRIIFISTLFFISTFGGDKSVMVYPLIIMFLGYLSRPNLRVQIKGLIFFGILFLVGGFGLYFIVVSQYPDLIGLSDFFEYFLQRIFVAQLVGVYEQYSLNISDFEYIYKAIPLPSSIFDSKSYHKDLMILSEEILDPDSIGIKNTFFVAEAHAIGGGLLVFFSAFLFAIPYVISFYFLKCLFVYFIKSERLSMSLSAVTFFYFQRTTGGFTEILLFKNFLLVVFALLPCFLMIYVVAQICSYKSKN